LFCDKILCVDDSFLFLQRANYSFALFSQVTVIVIKTWLRISHVLLGSKRRFLFHKKFIVSLFRSSFVDFISLNFSLIVGLSIQFIYLLHPWHKAYLKFYQFFPHNWEQFYSADSFVTLYPVISLCSFKSILFNRYNVSPRWNLLS